MGKPTTSRLIEYREKMNESLQPGGVNDHLKQSPFGTAWIETNTNCPQVVVKFVPHAFEVV